LSGWTRCHVLSRKPKQACSQRDAPSPVWRASWGQLHRKECDLSITRHPTVGPSYVGGYADVALVYRAHGWDSPLPLPEGQKWPPPTGFTGADAEVPTAEQIEAWRKAQPGGNTALRLPNGVLAVDIDNYAKGLRQAGRALEVIGETEARAGCQFPATWTLRNRTDGSEKRVYRVPKGLRWRGVLGAGVDIIHTGHRYLNVGVNPTTRNPEKWFDPEGNLSLVPPRPEELVELPGELVFELMHVGGAAPKGSDGGVLPLMSDEVMAKAMLAGMPTGPKSFLVCEKFGEALSDLTGKNGSRHDQTWEHLYWLVQYGAGGLPGVPEAIEVLRTDFVEAVWDTEDRNRSRRVAASEFDSMLMYRLRRVAARGEAVNVGWGLGLRSIEPGGWAYELERAEAAESTPEHNPYKVFKVLGPADWAAQVVEPEFLISKVLGRDTFGVSAGPKKSLKTHDNQAIAFAVATGQNLYLSDHFPVPKAGRVLYVVGEGGEVPVRRTLHRMGRAYGLARGDLMRDPSFPLLVAFGTAPIDSEEFRDEMRRMLNDSQPDLVLIESFYNFHPRDLEAGNLYQRGQVIDEFHKFVRAECEGATSMMTDHYRSTASGKSLDLDNISMAGPKTPTAGSFGTTESRQGCLTVSSGCGRDSIAASGAGANGTSTGTWARSTTMSATTSAKSPGMSRRRWTAGPVAELPIGRSSTSCKP
jgi:hypothetical protein